MRFAPEVHEVNHAGTKKPLIKSPMAKRAAAAMRTRMQEKLGQLNFLNVGQFGTLADADAEDNSLVQGNLEIGHSFED